MGADSSRGSISAQAVPPHLPRQHPRHEIRGLIYVTLDNGNGGLLHDVCEQGISLHAVSSLTPGQRVQVRFELPTPRTRVEATGTVVWSKRSGETGIGFSEINSKCQSQLKEWIFTKLLADASRVRWDALESESSADGRESDQLILSGRARPIIQLSVEEAQPPRAAAEGDDILLEFSWWPVAIPSRKFSWSVDVLAVFAAVLLFALVFLPVTFEELSLVNSLAVLLASVAVFSALYWLYFAALGVSTAGVQLTKMAKDDYQAQSREEREANRFR